MVRVSFEVHSKNGALQEARLPLSRTVAFRERSHWLPLDMMSEGLTEGLHQQATTWGGL